MSQLDNCTPLPLYGGLSKDLYDAMERLHGQKGKQLRAWLGR